MAWEWFALHAGVFASALARHVAPCPPMGRLKYWKIVTRGGADNADGPRRRRMVNKKLDRSRVGEPRGGGWITALETISRAPKKDFSTRYTLVFSGFRRRLIRGQDGRPPQLAGADRGAAESRGAHLVALAHVRPPLPPIIAECLHPRQSFAIFGPTRRYFAGNNVVRVAHWKTIDLHMPPPRRLKRVDAIGREDKVQVKRAVLDLHKSFPALHVRGLVIGQGKTKLAQCLHQSRPVLRRFQHKNIRILRGVRVSQ